MKIPLDGFALNVSDTGAGPTALVFLHPWGGSSRTWAGVVARLQDRFRCVAIDARGAGGSDAPASGYSTRDHAGDALAVIEALGLGRHVLVGHSMGGKAAQVLAARRPRGLAGLVLVASAPPSPMRIDDALRARMRLAYADRDAVDWSLDNVLCGSRLEPALRETLVADALRLSAVARDGWIDLGSREDFGAEVAAIEVPVAIVAGLADKVDPPEVVRACIEPHHPAASTRWLPDRGHLLPVEAPDAVAQVLRDLASSP